VPDPAVEALNFYLGTSGADVVPGLEPFRGASYSPTSARQAGVDGRISPHSLRHTFATIALDNGVALHDLQDSLGQADLRTTRRYDRWKSDTSAAGQWNGESGPPSAVPPQRDGRGRGGLPSESAFGGRVGGSIL
jgi:integrase/recombinase XerD